MTAHRARVWVSETSLVAIVTCDACPYVKTTEDRAAAHGWKQEHMDLARAGGMSGPSAAEMAWDEGYRAATEGAQPRNPYRPEPVVLPTEPGTVIAIGEWWLVRLRPYEPGIPAAWELLSAPRDVLERLRRMGIESQCTYGDDWVRAEAEQHGGFEVLSRPVKAVAAEVVTDVREHAESRGEDPDDDLFGLAKIGAKWGLA